MGGSGAGVCRRAPAIPLSRAGRRRCSETPFTHTHTHGRASQSESRGTRAARCMYISLRDGGFARVARCVRAMAPAALAHARPYSRVLAGHRKRDRVQLRVACVQCCLCKECGCEQSWQHCASHGVRHACVLDDAQPVSIIPCVRARERGRHGLRRPGQRAGAQRACCFLVPPWFWGAFFFSEWPTHH